MHEREERIALGQRRHGELGTNSPASSHTTTSHAASAAAAPARETVRRFCVTCAGLQYIALATSASAAILSAIDLHGVHSASARRLA